MKKRTFIATIAVAIIAGVSIFVACKKEGNNENTNLESLDSYNKLFSEEEIDSISSNIMVGVSNDYLNEANATSGGIVICTLWKKNRWGECKRLGICEWFPRSFFNNTDLTYLPERYVPCIIEQELDGNLRPLIIELKESVVDYPEDIYTFEISNDIEIDDPCVQVFGYDYVKISAGTYDFDESIGSFGGWQIPLYGIVSND